MARYLVHSVDTLGKTFSDEVEAESQEAAISTLDSAGKLAVKVEQVNTSSSTVGDLELALAADLRSVPTATVLSFYEQLGFLFKAGIPIFVAIRMLSEQVEHPRFAALLKSILFDLSEGMPLSSAIEKFPHTFPLLHVSLIAVGEKSGNLDEALNHLVSLIREQQEIKERLVKAAAYPIFLLGLSLALVAGLLLFIFPKFQDIFRSFDVALPITTQIFLTLSDYVRGNLALVGSYVVALVAGIVFFFRSEATSAMRDKLYLSLPLVRDIAISMFVALFSSILASMLKAGVPLLDALAICHSTLSSKVKREFLDHIISTVREGEPLSKGMDRQVLIPELARQLIIIGEKTGHLDLMFENNFLFYKKRYVDMLTKFTAVVQPVLLFFAAGLICLVAISLFVPLFKLSSSMRH